MKKHGDGSRRVLSDEELVALYHARDERAVGETDRKYGKYLYSLGYGILKDKRDIEECKSDTYLAAWNKIPPESPDPLLTYLAKLMRRISISRYRKNNAQKRRSTELTLAEEELESVTRGFMPTDGADSERIGELMGSFVRGLEERRRFIFVGRFYMSRSVSDLSRALKVSEATVYRDIEKIKTELRAYLEENGVYV